MTSASEIIQSLGIDRVWLALGGPPLRRGRGVAFWRHGDGLNVSLNTEKGCWHDFARGEGGGVLDLVEAVLECDRKAALKWCSDLAGIPLQDRALTDTERKEWGRARHAAEQAADRIAFWRMGAGMRLADEKLEAAERDDIERLAVAARALYELERAEPAELAGQYTAVEPGLRARDEAAGRRWRALCERVCAWIVTATRPGKVEDHGNCIVA